MVDENCMRNDWLMAKVVSVKPDNESLVRSPVVKTKSSTLERPISKLVLLLENESKQDQGNIPAEEPEIKD